MNKSLQKFWLIGIPVALAASLVVSMKILWLLAIAGAVHWVFRWGLRRMNRRGLLGIAVLLLSLVGLAFVPAGPTQITIAWDQQPGVDLFKVYSSTDVAVPLASWQMLTNAPGTNFSVSFPVKPGQMWFYVTASNFWGESGPSNTVGTPAVPGVTNTVIHKP